jgi:hypothetical protein
MWPLYYMPRGWTSEKRVPGQGNPGSYGIHHDHHFHPCLTMPLLAVAVGAARGWNGGTKRKADPVERWATNKMHERGHQYLVSGT